MKRVLLAVGGLVALLALGWLVGDDLTALATDLAGRGTAGALAFGAIYVIATVAFLPGSLLTLTAGAVFGVVKGVAIVFPSAVVGSTLAFVLSRYAIRPVIERRVADDPRFDAIDRAVGREGLWIVFLLRLSPLMPYNLLNYALGLTRVPLSRYVLASVGMIPGTILYVYSGRAIGDVVAIAGGAAAERGAAYYALLAIGLLATAVVTLRISRIAREALNRRTVDDGIASA